MATICEARHKNFGEWDITDNELAEMQEQFMVGRGGGGGGGGGGSTAPLPSLSLPPSH